MVFENISLFMAGPQWVREPATYPTFMVFLLLQMEMACALNAAGSWVFLAIGNLTLGLFPCTVQTNQSCPVVACIE